MHPVHEIYIDTLHIHTVVNCGLLTALFIDTYAIEMMGTFSMLKIDASTAPMMGKYVVALRVLKVYCRAIGPALCLKVSQLPLEHGEEETCMKGGCWSRKPGKKSPFSGYPRHRQALKPCSARRTLLEGDFFVLPSSALTI